LNIFAPSVAPTGRGLDKVLDGFGEYVRRFGPFPKQHYDVANAIMRCRTESLGQISSSITFLHSTIGKHVGIGVVTTLIL
jgi:hypothetical protein